MVGGTTPPNHVSRDAPRRRLKDQTWPGRGRSVPSITPHSFGPATDSRRPCPPPQKRAVQELENTDSHGARGTGNHPGLPPAAPDPRGRGPWRRRPLGDSPEISFCPGCFALRGEFPLTLQRSNRRFQQVTWGWKQRGRCGRALPRPQSPVTQRTGRSPRHARRSRAMAPRAGASPVLTAGWATHELRAAGTHCRKTCLQK